MRKYNKIFIIAAVFVVVLGTTLGIVTLAQADTAVAAAANVVSGNTTGLYDKVADILNQAKGTKLTGTDLQSAFQQAREQTADDALDSYLNKLVADGKITQQQATEYKNWINSRPSQMVSDQYKSWLESRPDITGLPCLPGKMGAGAPIPRMGGMMFQR